METERLGTLDEYGSRRFVIPAEVRGLFRRQRTIVYSVLLVIFLVLPWLKINGLQAVLLDIPGRRFEIFGQLFLAHDAPLLFLIFAALAMALAFVTAVWGRVWCGWACPQTVFIEGLYRKLEVMIQGNYIERRKLMKQPMNLRKFRLGFTKWFVFFVVSSIIAHSFIAYFTGSDALIEMMQNPPKDNWSYFLMVSGMTGLLLFNFGWFREQFCAIMCPYGRFQSVLMDDHSLAILYDTKRGEPRRQHPPQPGAKVGACVSCNRCVEVCPAGIDIRKGVQMECIACTACIDACDEIMVKTNQPTRLIGYQSVDGKGAKVWRPRTAIYFIIASLCVAGLAFDFSTHATFSATMMRGKDIPFQVLPDGSVTNHLRTHIFNQSHSDQKFAIRLDANEISRGIKLTIGQPEIQVPSGSSLDVHFFVTFPKEVTVDTGSARLPLHIQELITGIEESKEITIIGPARTHLQE